MSTIDALRAATVVPTLVFGLDDRGVLSSGRRADMLLIKGDPLQDITATRNVRKVWISGIEVEHWEGVGG
jgi:imidazolonepropionase-like amidohydrolase